jgi:hypothetical protein
VFDDNVGYGTELSNEALECDGTVYGSTAWYRFTAERSGRHVISTFGSDFDTVLAVYVANGVSIPTGAQEIDCNDDEDQNDMASFVEINAQAGQDYCVQVGGFDGGTGADEGNKASRPTAEASPTARPLGTGSSRRRSATPRSRSPRRTWTPS